MKKILIILLIFLISPSFASTIDDAYNFYKLENYKESLKIINKIEKQEGKSAKACLLKYQIYKKQNKLKEAKQELIEAISLDKNCYEAYVALSGLDILNFDSNSAEKNLNYALKINENLSKSSDFYYYLTKINILNNDFDSALKNIMNALEVEQDNLYYLELGKIYFKKNEYLKAINAFEYALLDDIEQNAEIYNYLGLVNYKRKNYKEAFFYFTKANERELNLLYLNNLALCAKTLNKNDLFEQITKKIETIEPIHPKEFVYLSKIFYSRGENEKAKDILLKGKEKFPDNVLIKNAINKLNKT